LRVTVTDNGPGISKERLLQLRATFRSDAFLTDHIGLYNTYKRLSLQYGPGDDSLLRILSKQGCGTCISLFFPQAHIHQAIKVNNLPSM
jgi:two-component system sensor histidine kinase YesM